MCLTSFATLLGLAAGCVGGAPPAVLAPADPRAQTRWHAPPSPLSGLSPYEPVTARSDWGALPARRPEPKPAAKDMHMKDMHMKGMDMKGMDMGGSR